MWRSWLKKNGLFLFFCFTSMLSCCGGELQINNLNRSEDFTVPSLHHDKLGIGGIVTHDPKIGLAGCKKFSTILYTAMKEKHPGERVFSREQVIEVIPREIYDLILAEFSDHRFVESSLLLRTASSETAFRYLLLGSIDQNEITKSRTEGTVPNAERVTASQKAGRDKENKEEWINRETTRTVRVTIFIFDLHDGKVVWNGSVEDSDSTTTSYTGVGDTEIAKHPVAWFGNTMFDVVYGPLLQPSAPSLKGMLKKIFGCFAQHIP